MPSRWRSLGVAALCVACSAGWPSVCVAAPAAGIRMPVPLDVPEVTMTVQARKAGVTEATVILLATIDMQGRVVSAEVAEPAGYGLDVLAREALLRARFEPARRDGRAIPAKVRFAFRIAAEPPPRLPAPPAPSGASEAVAPEEAPDAIDVTVEGYSEAELLRRSAQAVTVVELEEARRESADLGEVLARTEGVSVRRTGGLGSQSRLSLNGLTNDQIRFFLDDVPLAYAGFPSGVANIPVDFVERVDVYRGVVPIHLGADALGGALNIITLAPRRGGRVAATYQTGSFGTLRTSVSGFYGDAPTGAYVHLSGFHDEADNDYPVDVEVPDARGRLAPATVYRFHDRYLARGARLEVGVRDRAWAKRLSVQGFYTGTRRELQNNVVMTLPYGEARTRRDTGGGTLRYVVEPKHDVVVDVLASYAYLQTNFVDVGTCVYDWFGRCLRQRPIGGELSDEPHDSQLADHNVYARVHARYRAFDELEFEASITPTYFTRTGEDRLHEAGQRDPLSAQRDVVGVVVGVAGTLRVLEDEALENVTFAKLYHQAQRSEEPLPGGTFLREDRTTVRAGVGNGFRYRFFEGLTTKASYEFATRMPRPDEVFGDGVQVADNLDLEPEVSHNLNLQLRGELDTTPAGSFRARAEGFLRETDRLIVLLGNDRFFTYENVFAARSVGVEGAVGWEAPQGWVVVDANATYQDFRNTSSEGVFGDFEGDRIPNRPFLFVNASGRLQASDLFFSYDRLSVGYDFRFVGSFFRGWESVGLVQFKQSIDDQLTHGLQLQYLYRELRGVEASGTFEIQNLTDARVYDFFGVQRPGRAFYFKGTFAWDVAP